MTYGVGRELGASFEWAKSQANGFFQLLLNEEPTGASDRSSSQTQVELWRAASVEPLGWSSERTNVFDCPEAPFNPSHANFVSWFSSRRHGGSDGATCNRGIAHLLGA
jgi:hypothetical protein